MVYFFQSLFAVFRVVLCFYLLFGVLAPLFLPRIKDEKILEKLIYSWVGLGGLIIADVLILTILNLYDFISLVFTLFVIPFLLYVFINLGKGYSFGQILKRIEEGIVSKQVKILESFSFSSKNLKSKFNKKSFSRDFISPQVIAFLIASAGAIIRIIPALRNSAPFSRSWYYDLASVKALSLQQFFDVFPEPKGMHVIVHVFSTLTQVSPELILHILGALTSFFLAILIYWVIEVITESKMQIASLFGMAIYALTPALLLPISLDTEVEANSLSLALCFALPTCVFYLRRMRGDEKSTWFFIGMGIIATALTNLFVFLMVLFPVLFFGLFTLPGKFYLKRLLTALGYILLFYLLALIPYSVICIVNEVDPVVFIQQQLFNTLIFSYFPRLITELEVLSIVYMWVSFSLILICGYKVFYKKEENKKELVFLLFFALVAYTYTPYFQYSYILIDPDQLNPFYAVIISFFFGITFKTISGLLTPLFKKRVSVGKYVSYGLALVSVIALIVIQNGIVVSRALPQTLPNGFFNAYYSIVNERIPYTYATVGPEIDRELAQNRHFFMNYDFFLDNYGTIDSLYQEYLLVPRALRETKEVPPASIFLFLEKPPYSLIEQGILYDAFGTMNDMQQWISSFSELDGRNLVVYYESDDAIVYEIINRDSESDIGSILMNIWAIKEDG